MMMVASCTPFPLSAPCDVMLAMLVCASRWLSLHFYTLAHMSMHESCLLVCCPHFNTMKLWTLDPNLHFSLADTTFCLLVCLFACLLAVLLVCHIYYVYLLHASIMCSLHPFLPLLACWFLVFAFGCTHMEKKHMDIGHGFLGASKKGANVSMEI